MEHYRVKAGDTLSAIAAAHGLSLNRLLAANPMYKAYPDKMAIGDSVLIPLAEKEGQERQVPPGDDAGVPMAVDQPPLPAIGADNGDDPFRVPRGQLTFDAEGIENPDSKYFSRRPHVPGASSGVTIGRGYDMKERSEDGIRNDLSVAGAPAQLATALAGCSGLQGKGARQYCEAHRLYELRISPEVQKALFLMAWDEMAGDVLRLSSKHDVVAKYGATDWDNLQPAIRDILVDLRYRGDYTPATRQRLQPLVVSNDLAALGRLMADEDYWRSRCNVPRDRFLRRKRYLERP